MNRNTKIRLTAAALLCAVPFVASADVASGYDDALASSERPSGDKLRDAARRPKEVLEFVGIGDSMTVLDVAASTGWYTEVLAAAVGPDGRVIAHNTEGRRDRSEPGIAPKAERLGNVTLLFADFGSMGLDGEVDAALTALNFHDLHNRGAEAVALFLGDVYKALKPGGVFAVIDHEGSAGQDNKSLHRIESAAAAAALEQAGFVVEGVSDILDNPADDHSLHMRDESLQRNTDRFLIRARKPE
jgi:predicted methyltransferase